MAVTSDLDSSLSLQLAEQLIAIGDLNGAFARCAEILATEPGHLGARKLAAAIQYRSGMIAAYRINLDKRNDRLAQSIANEAACGFPEGFIQRVSAVEDRDYGTVGCEKSHIVALTDAFINRDSPYCMVLEDDFEFLEPAHVLTERLAEIKASGVRWDVLLLGAINVIPYQQPEAPDSLLRVFEAGSAAGYIVNRPYLPKLLNCFVEGVSQLERYRNFQPREAVGGHFSTDVVWWALQRRDHWYIANPAFGHQRPGSTDIAGRLVDFGPRTFYRWP